MDSIKHVGSFYTALIDQLNPNRREFLRDDLSDIRQRVALRMIDFNNNGHITKIKHFVDKSALEFFNEFSVNLKKLHDELARLEELSKSRQLPESSIVDLKKMLEKTQICELRLMDEIRLFGFKKKYLDDQLLRILNKEDQMKEIRVMISLLTHFNKVIDDPIHVDGNKHYLSFKTVLTLCKERFVKYLAILERGETKRIKTQEFSDFPDLFELILLISEQFECQARILGKAIYNNNLRVINQQKTIGNTKKLQYVVNTNNEVDSEIRNRLMEIQGKTEWPQVAFVWSSVDVKDPLCDKTVIEEYRILSINEWILIDISQQYVQLVSSNENKRGGLTQFKNLLNSYEMHTDTITDLCKVPDFSAAFSVFENALFETFSSIKDLEGGFKSNTSETEVAELLKGLDDSVAELQKAYVVLADQFYTALDIRSVKALFANTIRNTMMAKRNCENFKCI